MENQWESTAVLMVVVVWPYLSIETAFLGAGLLFLGCLQAWLLGMGHTFSMWSALECRLACSGIMAGNRVTSLW